jgi:DNA-binding transcriptional LysR family regulator
LVAQPLEASENGRVELRHLQYFVAVAEERHFGRAAQRVGIEQSPLSRAIRALEHDLGIRLLDRSSRGTSVTAAGEDFLSHARRILAATDQARSAMQISARVGARSFRIGLTPCSGQPRVAELIARSRTESVDQPITITNATLADIHDHVSSGILDCGISTQEGHADGVVAHKLWSESPALALPVDHPLAALPAITAGDLNDSLPIYVAAPHAPTAALVTSRIQAGAQGRSGYVQTLCHTEQMLTLVGSGLGIGIMSESAATFLSAPRVTFKKFVGEGISVTTWLLRKREIASPPICKLIRIARDLD